MSPKTAGKVARPKKESGKKIAPPSTGKAEKKSAKVVEEEIEVTEVDPEAPVVDLDELEEQEDAAAAESSSQSGNAAALAAATGGNQEMSASFKNFRHHPDMENFYRFIYENDLRHEALAIIDEIMEEKVQRRLLKGAKA
jgi:hypothetical protein